MNLHEHIILMANLLEF